MGPDFGRAIEDGMRAFVLLVLIVGGGIAIALWELGKFLFRHISIGWN